MPAELATHAKLVEGEGFEPSKSMTSDLQSDPFGRSGTPPKRGGIVIACHPTVKQFLIKNLRLALLNSNLAEPPPQSGRHSIQTNGQLQRFHMALIDAADS